MVDIWDLSQFVEGHPDDQGQRWRLVKAFYKSGEYRLALENLQILQNEMPDKKNIYRYMAATYYRLKRYEMAEKEVLEALEKWPDDLKFLEQYAQIIQESGDDERAADIWDDILLKEPNHRFAAKAVKKLRKKVVREHKPQGGGTATSSKNLCPHCGSENEPEFRQCWKCHSALSMSDSFAPPLVKVEEVPTPFYIPFFKAGIVISLIAGVYFTFREWSWITTPGNAEEPLATAYDYYIHSMFATRMAAGLLLLVLWSFVLRVSVYVSGVDDIDYDWLTICGLFFGGLTYLSTWFPAEYQWASLVCFVVVPFLLIMSTFRMTLSQRLMTWAIQFMIVVLLLATLAGALNGFGIVKDLPKLAGLVMSSEGKESSSLVIESTAPIVHVAEWESTGSVWLDSKVGAVTFTITTGPATQRMFLEVVQDQSILTYDEIESSPFRQEVSPVKPGLPYRVSVFGEDGVAVELSAKGILPYKVETESE